MNAKRIDNTKHKGRQLWKLFGLFGMLTLIAALTLAVALPVGATTTVFESYTIDDDSSQNIEGVSYVQTFTTTSAHNVNAVRVLLSCNHYTGTVTARIRATASSGLPTGADLCNGDIYLSNEYDDTWYEIGLGSGASLAAGTKYALFLNGTIDFGGGDDVYWRYDGDGGTNYPDGNRCYYSSGSWHTVSDNSDYLFQVLEITPNTITVTTGAGGTITPVGPSVLVDDGDDQTFTITPNTGYIIQDVLVDAVSQGSINEYTFENVTANHTIEASFTELFHVTDTGCVQATSDDDNSVSNEANAYDGNTGTYAVFDSSSDWASYWGFDFPDLPDGAIVTGIQVNLRGWHTSGSSRQLEVSLNEYYSSTPHYSDTKTTALTSTAANYTLGGPFDTWGYAWDWSDFNDTSRFRVYFDATSGGDDVRLYEFCVTVYYTTDIINTGCIKATSDDDNSVSNEANAYDGNTGTYAVFDSSTDWARYWGFNFTPSVTGTVTGIEVRLRASTTGRDLEVTFAEYDGSYDYSDTKTVYLTGSAVNYTLGGPTDTWGYDWSGVDFNDGSTFRIQFDATSDSSTTARLYEFCVTVYYVEEAGGTTCTSFYSSGDGYIETQGEDYSTIRDAASGTVNNETTTLFIGQDAYPAPWYYIDRSFVYFDTSAIPDGAVITSASIHLYGVTDWSADDFSLVIVNGQPTYPHSPLVAGDYDITQYSGNGGSFNTSGFSTTGYNTIDLNATGMGWINKTGTTKLGIFSNKDIDDSGVSTQEYVIVCSSAWEGTDHDPYLEVCYTTAGGGADAAKSTLTPTSSSITADGTSTQVLTVQAKDSSGNNITTGGATVTITKSSGTGSIGSAVDNSDGTYTANVTAPTAVGSGVFVATLNGDPVKSGTGSQTQATVNYVAGPASQVVLTGSSADLIAGSNRTFTATIKDAHGNVVANFTGAVTFAQGGSDTGSVTGLASPNAVAGNATNEVTGNQAGSVNITASINAGAIISNAILFNVVPGPTEYFGLNSPADITAGGARAAYTVTRYDAYDNQVTDAAQDVYIYTSSNGGAAAFYDAASAGSQITSLTIGAGNSSADFWYYDEKAGDWTITASDATPTADGMDGIDDATDDLTVLAALATQMLVETQPDGTGTVVPAQNVTAGSSITVYGIARDDYDNFVENSDLGTWKLEGKTGGVADTDLVAAGDNKSAVFTAHLVGTATISFDPMGFTFVDSGTITVVPGSPSQIVLSGSVADLKSGDTRQFTATVKDSEGNTVTDFAGTVTFAKTAGTGTLDGLGSATASLGVANKTVTGHSVGSVTIRASISSPSVINSNTLTFDVVPGDPTAVKYISPDTSNLVYGSTRTFTARIVDHGDNTVTGYVGNITFDKLSGAGTVGGLPSEVAVVSGQATSGTINATGVGTITIRASSDSLTPADVSFKIVPASTATTVTVNDTIIEWMDPIDFHAVISSTVPGALNGTVTFKVGSITYGTASTAYNGTNWVADLNDVQIANMPDATYTVTATFASSNPNFEGSSGTTTLHVDPRTANPVDTYGFYTGDRVAWTTGPNSNTATVKLAATLVDTREPWGNITQATVTFLLNGTPIPSAKNLPVGIVDPEHTNVGTAAAIVQINLSKGATSENFIITVEIGGAYTGGEGLSSSQIMIVVPTPGGRILGANALLTNVLPPNNKAAGFIGQDSLFSLSAFDIVYNKSLKNPQGKLSVFITSLDDVNGVKGGIHVYQVTSNAIAVLQVTGNKAIFSAKCTVKELICGQWVSVEGNAKLDVTMTDLNPANPSLYDTLAITVFKAQGGVWYSSNWNGVYTVEQNVSLFKDQLTVQ